MLEMFLLREPRSPRMDMYNNSKINNNKKHIIYKYYRDYIKATNWLAKNIGPSLCKKIWAI